MKHLRCMGADDVISALKTTKHSVVARLHKLERAESA